jgi:hypothetical protein
MRVTTEAPGDAQKAIMSTELRPDEDPALLRGPDRIELFPMIILEDVEPAADSRS